MTVFDDEVKKLASCATSIAEAKDNIAAAHITLRRIVTGLLRNQGLKLEALPSSYRDTYINKCVRDKLPRIIHVQKGNVSFIEDGSQTTRPVEDIPLAVVIEISELLLSGEAHSFFEVSQGEMTAAKQSFDYAVKSYIQNGYMQDFDEFQKLLDAFKEEHTRNNQREK